LLFGLALVRAPILCNDPLLLSPALARAPILCNNLLLFGHAFALAPILCDDPLLFATHLRLPPSSVTIHCCLPRVCAATILCNDMPLFGHAFMLPQSSTTICPCPDCRNSSFHVHVPQVFQAMLFLHRLVLVPSCAIAIIALSGAHQAHAVAHLFQSCPFQRFT
jgi:hypothetical protein